MASYWKERIQRTSNRLQSILNRGDDPSVSVAMETLRSNPLFDSFSWSNYHDLALVLHYRSYKKGDYIYYEDDPGLGLYLIQSGSVRLLFEDADGGVHEIKTLGVNDVFGHLSLMGDFRRTETAQATGETRLLGLFRPDLHRLMRQYPKTGAALLETVGRYITTRQMEMFSTLGHENSKFDALKILHCVYESTDSS